MLASRGSRKAVTSQQTLVLCWGQFGAVTLVASDPSPVKSE